jgi:hypothetical protein
MGNSDCGNSAESIDRRNSGLIEQADAIPQDVSGRGLQQERSLADSEAGVGMDGIKPFLFPPDGVRVSFGQLGNGGPLLAVPSHILTGILADRAFHRWFFRRRELGAAGNAKERCRGLLPILRHG